MTKTTLKDYRPQDILELEKLGIAQDWASAWEPPGLSRCWDKNANDAQNQWHLSRMSFLEGYKLALSHSRK